MKFKSTLLLTSLSTVVKVLSGIILNKITAIYLGTAGMAMLAQFQNFSGILISLANGSIQTGVVKKIAENDNQKYRVEIWTSASALILFLSFLSAIMVFGFSEQLSEIVFFDKKYTNTIQILSLSILFYAANIFFVSVLNGMHEIRQLTLVNMALSVTPVVIAPFFIIYFQIKGFFIALMLSQLIVFILSYVLILRKYDFNFFRINMKNFNIAVIKNLLKFGGVTLFNGVMMSLSMLFVRSMIIDSHSIESAGIWESAYKIAVYFNLVFILPLSIHYLPKFSSMTSVKEIKLEIKLIIKILLFTMLCAIIFINFFSLKIIELLYTKDFSPVEELLVLILVAEIFKIIGNLYETYFQAKRLHSRVLYINISFALLFVALIAGLHYLSSLSLLSVAKAYLLSNLTYLIMAYFFYRYETHNRNNYAV
jgi:polysaccharide transporter, PST family